MTEEFHQEPNTEPEQELLPEKQEVLEADEDEENSFLGLLDNMAPLKELAAGIVKPVPTLSELASKPKTSPSTRHIPMTRQQEINISKLSYQLYSERKDITPDAIRDIWPTDPAIYHRAGDRPTLTALQRHLPTDRFKKDMLALGIEYFYDEEHINGLTSEQAAVISYLTDMSSTKSFGGKLKDLGIKPVTWKLWMRQKAFADAVNNFSKSAMEDSIPMAEVQLAAAAAAGDLKTIKYLFEVTGRHDPASKQQIDTQAMLGVIIDTAQEVFGQHPELLREFANQITIKSRAIKGIL